MIKDIPGWPIFFPFLDLLGKALSVLFLLVDLMAQGQIVSQDGKLSAATLKWDLHPQPEYQFWECIVSQPVHGESG